MKAFRHLFIALLALTLVMASSCDKDDDEAIDSPLVGTWEFIESVEGFSITMTMTFNPDLTGTSNVIMVIGGETLNESTTFTYSTNGSNLTLKEGGLNRTLTYSITGNKLTLTEDGEEMVFTRK